MYHPLQAHVTMHSYKYTSYILFEGFFYQVYCPVYHYLPVCHLLDVLCLTLFIVKIYPSPYQIIAPYIIL